MATDKFSRRTRAGNKLKPVSDSKSKQSAARMGGQKAGPAVVAAAEVRTAVLRLKHLRSIILTVEIALWHQSADHDGDIALALQHGVANPLLTEIERLEKLANG